MLPVMSVISRGNTGLQHKMSVALYSASGNNASLQGTTVGGTKPLHRFLKGQPKIIGVIVLILGSSFFIISMAIMSISHFIRPSGGSISPGIILGIPFIICGILFILTEHNPTKKKVTISLALSIINVLLISWSFLQAVPDIIHSYQYSYYHYHEENITGSDEAMWVSYYENMGMAFQWVILSYILLSGITFVVMAVMAGAAIRSTKSQAMIVMTIPTSETQVEQREQEDGLNCDKMSE